MKDNMNNIYLIFIFSILFIRVANSQSSPILKNGEWSLIAGKKKCILRFQRDGNPTQKNRKDNLTLLSEKMDI